jgi:hypothetical protein
VITGLGTSYARFVVSGIAPATTVYANLVVSVNNGGNANNLYFDDALLVRNPFLVLADTIIPAFMEPIEAEVHRAGDETEAYDLTPLTRRRAVKREWACRTPWLDTATALEVLTVLEGTPPTAATGALTGGISVIVKRTGERVSTFAGGVRMKAYDFTVREV